MLFRSPAICPSSRPLSPRHSFACVHSLASPAALLLSPILPQVHTLSHPAPHHLYSPVYPSTHLFIRVDPLNTYLLHSRPRGSQALRHSPDCPYLILDQSIWPAHHVLCFEDTDRCPDVWRAALLCCVKWNFQRGTGWKGVSIPLMESATVGGGKGATLEFWNGNGICHGESPKWAASWHRRAVAALS